MTIYRRPIINFKMKNFSYSETIESLKKLDTNLFGKDFLLTWQKSDDELKQILFVAEVAKYFRDNNISFNGRGVSTDIIEASAKAYLQALGLRLHHFKNNTPETIDSGI